MEDKGKAASVRAAEAAAKRAAVSTIFSNPAGWVMAGLVAGGIAWYIYKKQPADTPGQKRDLLDKATHPSKAYAELAKPQPLPSSVGTASRS
ncbi:hypothetical protein RvY_13056 [Ramazzottius varieornatus]|uniref:Uncharacterized protein n=1 Tax=Ramazzottius varieornatus TaxID=947166 RepID=A0A1D1VLM6_RAMVA|nr:hypothetical protein RvY_13056 [Ramazzottius varieornatus]